MIGSDRLVDEGRRAEDVELREERQVQLIFAGPTSRLIGGGVASRVHPDRSTPRADRRPRSAPPHHGRRAVRRHLRLHAADRGAGPGARPARGAEELSLRLNDIYDALIAQVHAIAAVCWLSAATRSPAGSTSRATAAGRRRASGRQRPRARWPVALAMQATMRQFAAIAPGDSEGLRGQGRRRRRAGGALRRRRSGYPDHRRAGWRDPPAPGRRRAPRRAWRGASRRGGRCRAGRSGQHPRMAR